MNPAALDQEIVDILRTHGQLTLDDIAERVTLTSDKTKIAHALHSLSRGRTLTRNPQTRRYNIGTGQIKAQPDEAFDVFSRTPPPQQPKPAAAPKQDSKPAPKQKREPTRLHDLTKPITHSVNITMNEGRPVRIEDLETPHPDPVETLLTSAAASAQENLDKFITEIGDIAVVMGALIDARDRTVEALDTYRESKHHRSHAA